MNNEVAIIGVGMHAWGKWNKPFFDYGLDAARQAMANAGVQPKAIQFLSSAATMRNGYAGYVAGATFARLLGLQQAELCTSFAGCASGGYAIGVARSKILAGDCDLALVVAADTATAGMLGPLPGELRDDPDWIRHYLGFSNLTYLALMARRRMEIHGATDRDFSNVKVKNSHHGAHNNLARYRRAFSIEEVMQAPMVADPLRLFHISSTSDGGAAIVLSSLDYARRHALPYVRVAAVSTAASHYPCLDLQMPFIATHPSATASSNFVQATIEAAYERAGIGPNDLSIGEVYDLSSAMELDSYEQLGLCPPGDAERLLREGVTSANGRVPINASGGLSSLGEALAAQALAQICELTWQLRGQAGQRQVNGALAGIAVAQGIFGHASAIILKR